MTVLGTDGLGRSDTRRVLRRFFGIDAESITLATLTRLAREGAVAPEVVSRAMRELGVDPRAPYPPER
jgi:pyruvate dehydrogenase E1 component